jgi:hypothetical protein
MKETSPRQKDRTYREIYITRASDKKAWVSKVEDLLHAASFLESEVECPESFLGDGYQIRVMGNPVEIDIPARQDAATSVRPPRPRSAYDTATALQGILHCKLRTTRDFGFSLETRKPHSEARECTRYLLVYRHRGFYPHIIHIR